MMVHTENPTDLKPTLTSEGIEMMFATNVLGHFLLTNLLMSKIIAAAKTAPKGSVRIINLSSTGTYVSALRVSDINFQKPTTELPEKEKPALAILNQAGLKCNETMAYIPTAAYGQSKTCAILLSVAWSSRLFEKHGILSLALNPGEIQTELGRHTDAEWLDRAVKQRQAMGIHLWKTQGGGGSTTIVAACDPKLSLPADDGSGYYLSDCQIAKAPGYATDREDAEKLWEISEGLTGEKFAW
jgi:NAD(P)-dependent dehydrogenase (short-subunit alcohol dehydrogenase family)